MQRNYKASERNVGSQRVNQNYPLGIIVDPHTSIAVNMTLDGLAAQLSDLARPQIEVLSKLQNNRFS